jgi:molybdopterin-guanine dinucleotide biosynthesis protein B
VPPIVSIVGYSDSGKTTLMEKLVAELGKDSWRHLQAGSDVAVISSPDELILMKPLSKEPILEQLAHLLGEDYDIILTEGFSRGDAPKIEVHRQQVGPLLPKVRKLVAIVTDEPLETKTRQFASDDVKGLADLLEKGFIQPNKERLSLYVNHTPIVLTVFPRQIIANILLALASSLKGVKKIKALDIFYRQP